MRQGSPTYIGRVPSAISSIWGSTKATAEAASRDSRVYQVECAGKQVQCAGLAQTLTNDLDALQLEFQGWQPYELQAAAH